MCLCKVDLEKARHRGRFDDRGGEGDYDNGSRHWSDVATNQGMQWPPKDGRSKKKDNNNNFPQKL